jgi:hypothetical protein
MINKLFYKFIGLLIKKFDCMRYEQTSNSTIFLRGNILFNIHNLEDYNSIMLRIKRVCDNKFYTWLNNVYSKRASKLTEELLNASDIAFPELANPDGNLFNGKYSTTAHAW